MSSPLNTSSQFSSSTRSSTSSLSETKKKISISDFTILSQLGKGSYGKVHLAQSLKTQKLYAIKTLDKFFLEKLNKTHEAFIEREMLTKLNHKYIMKIITCFQNSQKLFFVMNYLKNGSLQDIIHDNVILPKQIARFYLAQIVSVLEYFQHKQIAHLDLKPHNILIDDNKYIKLIDLATCTYIGKEYDMNLKQFVEKTCNTKYNNEIIGTIEYISPEMLYKNVQNEKGCDIWALGIIMYQMFHGFTPFKGDCNEDTIENILEGKYALRQDLDEDVKDLIIKLLQYNPGSRIGMNDIQEIKMHSFFENIDFDNIEYPNELNCLSLIMDDSNIEEKELIVFPQDENDNSSLSNMSIHYEGNVLVKKRSCMLFHNSSMQYLKLNNTKLELYNNDMTFSLEKEIDLQLLNRNNITVHKNKHSITIDKYDLTFKSDNYEQWYENIIQAISY